MTIGGTNMYFPYLRGRQFELLALRDLAELDLIGEQIIPIIEPIKPSSTLISTIKAFNERNKKLAVILNPQVGNFSKELTISKAGEFQKKFMSEFENDNLILSHLINDNSIEEVKEVVSSGHNINEILIINKNKEYLNTYFEIFKDDNPKYNLIPEEMGFTRKIKVNKVLIADRFDKKLRNADYFDIESTLFSEDHLYFEEDGFLGFSDYSIVGEEYSESGFAPYAVVIHIVYFDDENNLRVKHFVSDSNSDISDPAGKFYEALEKCISWIETKKIDTHGLRELRKHYSNGTYPGLGIVKKLAIMHHIELINQFFSGDIQR